MVVTTGKDAGKRGRVLQVVPEKNRLLVEGVNLIKRHTKPNPGKNIKGGRSCSARRRSTRATCSSCAPSAGPRRASGTGCSPTAAGPRLPQVRGSGRQMSRLRERYVKDVVPALKKEFGYTNVMAIPKIQKVVVNMGLGEATANAKIIDVATDELGRITGPEARRTPREEVDRAVQGARGHAGRRVGDAARRPDVRLPRSAGEHRAAARPRLQGDLAQGLRRPGQLHARASGTSCCSRRSTT